MVNYSARKLDLIFSALSDPTRRAILDRLSQGEATVTEVAEQFDTSLPAISRHIKVLEGARLVLRRRVGRIHHLSLAAAPMMNAAQWLEQYRMYWESRLDSLEHFLKERGDEEPGQSG